MPRTSIKNDPEVVTHVEAQRADASKRTKKEVMRALTEHVNTHISDAKTSGNKDAAVRMTNMLKDFKASQKDEG